MDNILLQIKYLGVPMQIDFDNIIDMIYVYVNKICRCKRSVFAFKKQFLKKLSLTLVKVKNNVKIKKTYQSLEQNIIGQFFLTGGLLTL